MHYAVQKNRKSGSSPTFIKPNPECAVLIKAAARMLAVAVALAGCAATPPFVPVSPLLASALSSRGEDEQIRKRIAELEIKEDWPGLSSLAVQYLAQNPADDNWMVIVGYARLKEKDYRQAIDALTSALQRSPEDIDARNLLGEAFRLSEQPERAVQVLEHAVAIDPTSPATRFLLGEAYRDSGRLERAKSAYLESVRIEPSYSAGWFGLVMLLSRTGPREEFEKALKQLETVDPELAQEVLRTQKK
jgi:cytochrome c-type biogenesis protein CcmH/NrfG